MYNNQFVNEEQMEDAWLAHIKLEEAKEKKRQDRARRKKESMYRY